MIFNYIRVSTIEQNTERQLRDVVCDRVYEEKISGKDYLCLADSRIKKLDMFIRHFTIDELARLVANIPDLTGEITKPYKECSIIESGEKTTYYLLCKGKRKLIKGKDDDKLKKYLEDYNSLVEKYKIEYT